MQCSVISCPIVVDSVPDALSVICGVGERVAEIMTHANVTFDDLTVAILKR